MEAEGAGGVLTAWVGLAIALCLTAGAPPAKAQVPPADSPAWFLTDEEGERLTREVFLASLHPLPPGQLGSLTLARWHLTGDQTVAVFSYDADEVHDFYGQHLTTRFHMTVTAKDSGLVLERDGRPPQRLYALDDRIFIRHGVRGFWVFQRDSAGAVIGLVNWRDNNAVVWGRSR